MYREFAARLANVSTMAAAILVCACSDSGPVSDERYAGPDSLFETIDENISKSADLEKIVGIDHSRLGVQAGSTMPPARVLIFSDPQLEAYLVQKNPLVAIDLPLRALAYESAPEAESRVIYNSFEFLQSRYGLGDEAKLAARYAQSMSVALANISQGQIAGFENNAMQPDGIVTLPSPVDFNTTVERIKAAIDAQDDTVWFGDIDFQSRSLDQGIKTAKARLLLFGAPAPGAKAMVKAVTLGLDAFCQKFLVWQDVDGNTFLSFNDLLEAADRQGVSKSIALRVVNYRLKSTFSKALESK